MGIIDTCTVRHIAPDLITLRLIIMRAIITALPIITAIGLLTIMDTGALIIIIVATVPPTIIDLRIITALLTTADQGLPIRNLSMFRITTIILARIHVLRWDLVPVIIPVRTCRRLPEIVPTWARVPAVDRVLHTGEVVAAHALRMEVITVVDPVPRLAVAEVALVRPVEVLMAAALAPHVGVAQAEPFNESGRLLPLLRSGVRQ